MEGSPELWAIILIQGPRFSFTDGIFTPEITHSSLPCGPGAPAGDDSKHQRRPQGNTRGVHAAGDPWCGLLTTKGKALS